MSGKPIRSVLVIFLAAAAAWLVTTQVAFAQSETPYDLVDAVNSLRASYGLEPYQIDPWLMAYAQEHSEYQAEMQSGTHLHRDGVLPWEIGIQENVAGGTEGLVTCAVVVNQIWVDWGHKHILTGYTRGEIGAGMARGDNGLMYFTVDIRPAAGLPTIVPEQGTPEPFAPYATSTPDADGAIYHVVGDGQALWSIAISYGVTVNDIRQLNGIPTDSIVIQVGQKLLIRPASALTTAPAGTQSPAAARTAAQTPIPATRTRAATETREPADTKIPTDTELPSLASTIVPTSEQINPLLSNRQIIGVIGLGFAVIGFVLVIIFGFRKVKDKDN
jgi:hypothetical protein